MQTLEHTEILCFVTEIKFTCCDSFGVEHIPEEIKNFIRNKSIIANIFRVQTSNSLMCGYLCVGFIGFMLAGKKPTDLTNIFFPHDFKNNDNTTLTYLKDE